MARTHCYQFRNVSLEKEDRPGAEDFSGWAVRIHGRYYAEYEKWAFVALLKAFGKWLIVKR